MSKFTAKVKKALGKLLFWKKPIPIDPATLRVAEIHELVKETYVQWKQGKVEARQIKRPKQPHHHN